MEAEILEFPLSYQYNNKIRGSACFVADHLTNDPQDSYKSQDSSTVFFDAFCQVHLYLFRVGKLHSPDFLR